MSEIEVTVTQEPVEVVISGGQGPRGAPGPTGPQGPQGLPGEAQGIQTVVHDQQVASDHWIINHTWPGGFPSVTIVDTSGAVVLANPVYTSAIRIDLYFSSPFSGKAYLN